MRINSRVFFLSLMTITVSMLAINLRPAVTQSTPDDPFLIKATPAAKYGRYYAPYAIQAAVAYLPVAEFEDRHLNTDSDRYGADVNYAVKKIFAGDEAARKAIRGWQYQFGSESYLTCYDSTDTDCQTALRNKGWDFGSGPSFQVWARTRFPHSDRDACSEVSIAFRGTMGWNGGDWFSNADRFYSPYDDYYHQIRRNIDGIIHAIRGLDCYRRARSQPQIVSTGHSLGGGLAQLAALANKPNGPRITKVFAFDPSPVTGAHLVEKELLRANAAGLTIDRIYQEGEVLSYARDVIQEYPSAKPGCDPFVRTVKFDAVSARGAIGLHGINPLAVQMVQASYDGDLQLPYHAPASPPTCKMIRYVPPATDEDGVVVATVGARIASARAQQAQYASASRYGEYVDQYSPSYRSGVPQGDPTTELKGVKIHRTAFASGERRSKKLHVANSF
jgi:pimeloyl-ACP methyl ester carboxylesterase